MARILVVDDQEMMRDSLLATLKREGHDVTGCGEAQKNGRRSCIGMIKRAVIGGERGLQKIRRHERQGSDESNAA